MTTKLLRPTPPRQHTVSIRFTEQEIVALNHLIDLTGTAGSEILRYGAMRHVHRELRERLGTAVTTE